MDLNISESIRNSGVVGCGGAGFPAHVKAASSVEYVIANGAECEPLLHKDLELMIHQPEAVVKGMQQLISSTGAKKALIGVKRKYEERLSELRRIAERADIELKWLGDFYPTGDEYVLVYESTNRLIPPHGIPLDVGVVVNNVETLRNLSRASEGFPVTTKYVTVAGAVRNPSTFEVPIGISLAEVIAAAGGPSVTGCAVFVGGLMMGKLETDLSLPVTKTCAGLVVLPADHRLVQRSGLQVEAKHRIGKSACDQCSYCTEFCPRYLLGYDVQPHKVMRSLSFTATGEAIWNQWADLCCSCGLCTLYACPEELYPKEACDKAKADLKEAGVQWKGEVQTSPHSMYDGRHVPLRQLVRKLGIAGYDVAAPFLKLKFSPRKVRLPLQAVKAGELIGEIPAGKLGARVHASMDGVVTAINGEIVIEQL